MTERGRGDGTVRRVLLGVFGAAHGIRGEVSIKSYTADPADIANYGPLTDSAGKQSFKLRIVRASAKGVIVRVEGVANRNDAEALRNIELYAPRSALPAASAGEYYHVDLIGLDAELADGAAFGKVVAVQNFGAGDLLEVARPDGETDFIPFDDAHVPSIDFAAARLTIVPPQMSGEPEPASDGMADDD